MKGEGDGGDGAGRGVLTHKRLTARLDCPDEMQAILQHFSDQIGAQSRLLFDLQDCAVFLISLFISERASRPRPAALSSLRDLEESARRLQSEGWTGPLAETVLLVINEQIEVLQGRQTPINDQIAQAAGRQRPRLVVVPTEDANDQE